MLFILRHPGPRAGWSSCRQRAVRASLGKENAGSLAEVGYFTTLRNRRRGHGFRHGDRLLMQERPDHLVEVHVTLPLKTSRRAPATVLSLRVADPEFFIDF